MNTPLIRAAIVALAAAASATAFAQTPTASGQKTRQQVLAELADAQRNGELQVAGELASTTGLRQPAASTVTRDDVRTELLRAKRQGALLVGGELGLDSTAAWTVPGAAPAALQVAGKTRAQVKAELAEAQRNGELLVAGESGALQRDVAGRARSVPGPATPALAAVR